MVRTLLAIESSTDWLSVALLEGDDVVALEDGRHGPGLDGGRGRVAGGLDAGVDAGVKTEYVKVVQGTCSPRLWRPPGNRYAPEALRG